MLSKIIIRVLLGSIAFSGSGIHGFPSMNQSVKEDNLTSSPQESSDIDELELGDHPDGTAMNNRTEDEEPQHFLNRAIGYMYQKQWDSAYTNILKVLNLEPDNIMALMNRGFILLHWKSPEEALKDFISARRLADEQNVLVETKIQIFEWLMEAHKQVNYEAPLSAPEGEMMRLENLEEDAQWRVVPNPCSEDHDAAKPSVSDPATLAKIGNRYYYEFQFDEALKCYNKTIEIQNNVAMHYRNRALCLMHKEAWTFALDNIEKALKLEPDNVRALYYHSSTNFRLDRYEVALDNLDRAFKLTETTVVSFEAQKQMFKLIESVCETAVKLTQHKSKITVILSRALLRDGYDQRAIDLLKKGLEKAEENKATSDEKREIQSLLISAQKKLSSALSINESEKTTDMTNANNTNLEKGAILQDGER